MKPRDRRVEIAELIGRSGKMSVDALAAHFGVSPETIRRDLGRLAENGVVQKVHGGAKRPRLHSEASLAERMSEGAEAKRCIARKLLSLVEPGDTILIDTGSTTVVCAEELAVLDGLTIITNSVGISQTFAHADRDGIVFLLGGEYSADNSQTVGPLVIEQIRDFRADHAILTVAAVDPRIGVMDASFAEATIARAMLESAGNVIVVADSSKFGRKAAFRVCGFDKIDVLVSDRRPCPVLAAALAAAGAEMR